MLFTDDCVSFMQSETWNSFSNATSLFSMLLPIATNETKDLPNVLFFFCIIKVFWFFFISFSLLICKSRIHQTCLGIGLTFMIHDSGLHMFLSILLNTSSDLLKKKQGQQKLQYVGFTDMVIFICPIKFI